MRRMTLYLEDDIHAAVVRHAESRGQKLSTFVNVELAHLLTEPVVESVGVKALRQFATEAAKRGA